jgi:hypothetical protein
MTISAKETTMTDFNELADRYVATWNEPDVDLRRRSIAEIWAPDGRYCNGRAEYAGHVAIQPAVTTSHVRWVGSGYVFRSRKNAEGHHNGVRFSWEMVPAAGGDVVSIGSEFVILDDDGRIRHDYQFIDR